MNMLIKITLLSFALAGLIYGAFFTVGIILNLLPLLLVIAVISVLIITGLFGLSVITVKRPARQTGELSFALKQDLHLLHWQGVTHQVEELLRFRGVMSADNLHLARTYLHLIQVTEPRLNLLNDHHIGEVFYPASDAGNILPFTGKVTLEHLNLQADRTEQTFTVLDDAGQRHVLYDWQAHFLTKCPLNTEQHHSTSPQGFEEKQENSS